jgi:putative ABC transport system permease protein
MRFLRDDLAEEVLGDLEEKFYANLHKKSLRAARLNYWYQVLQYFRPFAIKKSPTINTFDMYLSYFKIGWRNLLKQKGYSAINIGGLAIGISVAILIGLWIHDELSYNKYFEHYETIGQIYRLDKVENETEASTPQVAGLGTLLKNSYNTQFKSVVMVRAMLEERVIALSEKKFTQHGYFMQPEGGDMFSLKMKHGSRDGLKDKMSILLSASVAEKLFGEADPINQIVSMDAKWDIKVAGVYEDLPRNTRFHDASFFAPLELYMDGGSLDSWDNYFLDIYVQIHENRSFEEVSSIIKNATLPHLDEEKRQSGQEVFIHPMREWHLNSEFRNGHLVTSPQQKAVWLYGVIGAFVLFLACINFMNLSTARSEKRSREVGIRKSIGSYRTQLVQQFLGESILVACIAFVLSIVIVGLALPWFNFIADKNMTIPWTNYLFWLSGIGFTIVTGLLAGSYPALYLSSFQPVKVLKGTFKPGIGSSISRRVLVVFQFTVSVSLIIGTVIVYQQIQYAKSRPAGYSPKGLLSLRAGSPEFRGKYDVLRTQLKATGAVEDIAESNYSVTSTKGWNGGFSWKGRTYDPSFNTIFVSYDYGRTVGLDFIDGRDFSREVASDTAGILINESAAKEFGIENPVGELLKWAPGGSDRGTYQILGVVKDMIKGSPYEQTRPSVIFLSRNHEQWLYVRVNPDLSLHDALPKIEAVFKALVPSAPFDFRFADDEYNAKFRAEERTGQLAGIFSLLTIFISCSGLFALSAFTAEQRKKEIGIRKAFGASLTDIWTLLSREFFLLVMISCLVAVPLSYYAMSSWLEQYQYRTTISMMVFILAAGAALGITMVTVSFQAFKTGIMKPVEALKQD